MTHIVIMNQTETIEWSPTMGVQVTSVTGVPLATQIGHEAIVSNEIELLGINHNTTTLELL